MLGFTPHCVSSNCLEIDGIARVLPSPDWGTLYGFLTLEVNESVLAGGRLFIYKIWPQVDATINRLQCKELEDLLENVVIEALHLSPLHTVEQLLCVGRPKDVPHWVGTVVLPQVQGVELVGEEAYVVVVHQHCLGGEWVGGVEVQIETYGKTDRRIVNIHAQINHRRSDHTVYTAQDTMSYCPSLYLSYKSYLITVVILADLGIWHNLPNLITSSQTLHCSSSLRCMNE